MIPVLPGDGIGPLVTHAALEVLRAVGQKDFAILPFGHDCWLRTGVSLPRETEQVIREQGVALLGAATSPKTGCTSPILTLRRRLELDLLIRPAAGVVVVGHAFDGLYGQVEDPGPPAIAQWIVTETGADRLVAEAFARATTRITLVDKPTVLRGAAELFRAAAVRHQRPGLAFELVNLDAFLARFIRDQRSYDILAATSLISDLLSDLTAALDCGIGGAPSASLGRACAIFEPVHGSAPKHANTQPPVMDPTGAILAAAMLLDHVGQGEASRAVQVAVQSARGERPTTTADWTRAVLSAL